VAKQSDPLAGALDADKAGLLSGFLAEEDEFDRRSLWRIGTWGAAAVGAVVLAATANQWSLGVRRDQVAAADLTRQAQQIQALAKESQNETRRLASAIDTLNGDRDRLFSRVTVVEQGLDSVTGAIAKQNAANAAKPPVIVSAMPAMMTPPPVIAADGPPATATAAPGQIAAPAVAPVTTMAAAAPEKPRTDAAKPEAAAPAPSLPQIASSKPAVPLPPPAAAQPLAGPAPALGAVKSMMGPPDAAAPKLVEPAKDLGKETAKTANAKPVPAAAPVPAQAAPPAPEPFTAATPDANDNDKSKDQEKPVLDADRDSTKATIQRTEFAVDLGGANSIGGLRGLWRGLLKSNNAELAELRPIIVLREGSTGLGMQLRLAAGPLHDAAEAAKICASLVESQRACETTVFDGQRLAMSADEQQQPGAKPQPGAKSQSTKRYYSPKHSKRDDAPTPKETSTFSSLFGGGKR
jgi:hypothetical protein